MKSCKECNRNFRGRTDKLFCSVKCKNRYNYKLKERIIVPTAEIDKILHRNYVILLEEMKHAPRTKKIKRLILAKKKFDFNYLTNYRVNSKGKVYHYVYDLAWMAFSDNEVLIVKR